MPDDTEDVLLDALDKDIEPPLPGTGRSAQRGGGSGVLRRARDAAAGMMVKTPAASKQFFWFCAGVAVMTAGLAIITGSIYLFAVLLRWLWQCWCGA